MFKVLLLTKYTEVFGCVVTKFRKQDLSCMNTDQGNTLSEWFYLSKQVETAQLADNAVHLRKPLPLSTGLENRKLHKSDSRAQQTCFTHNKTQTCQFLLPFMTNFTNQTTALRPAADLNSAYWWHRSNWDKTLINLINNNRWVWDAALNETTTPSRGGSCDIPSAMCHKFRAS